jgi:GMP synthase (glutamine-hydrolysing)
MRLHLFQHVSFEALGAIERWALERDFEITRTRFFEPDHKLPDMSAIDMLVIMGGPMNIYEEESYPHLRDEKRLIKEALDSCKHVLGICLGAQLVADVLGAKTTKNERREIGFFDVTLSAEAQTHPLCEGFPQSLPMFHWHGDRFDLPEGATLLASSAACDHQAFSYGNKVLCWQSHPEMTRVRLREMMDNLEDELHNNGRYIQSRAEILAQQDCLPEVNAYLFTMLDRWLEMGDSDAC